MAGARAQVVTTVVPDGFRDDSSLLFTKPLAGRPGQPEATLAIHWENAGPRTARAELDARAKGLADMLPGFVIRARGDAGTASTPIPYLEYDVAGPVPVMQILLVRRLDGLIVWFTGTSRRDAYAQHRRSFFEAARHTTLPR